MTTTTDRGAGGALARLLPSSGPLVDDHDVVLLDLDGVVYIGPHAVPGAAEHLGSARSAGARLVFVTNNASRPPAVVAQHLTDLGVDCEETDVVTSAQAAAHHLRSTLGAGARVLRIGGAGLTEALEAEGLQPVDSLDDEPVAVVQGFSPDLTWRHLAEATRAVRSGLPWVATNLDLTVPVVGGPAPGNGTLVGAVRTASGVEPYVVGKPEPALFAEAVRRSSARRPLVVGDRLDTDLEGARRAGLPGLLVLTGVSGIPDLLTAHPGERPTHVSWDLRGLLDTHPDVRARVDGRRVEVTCGAVVLTHADGGWDAAGIDGADALDVVRAAAVAAWSAADAGLESDTALLHRVAATARDDRQLRGDVAAGG
ncbi:HAD superfamily hydrolase (TIGR01450 family) [Kineococcus xinjiangensis]|uniref:HAD superfamily hydrolase (TIGR01450 family) n=1 Tax=Kineococcus xinjiangensis TaxID=512762 RepID=A0A2S6IC88_9ACTN|nr:HAD-IIA family hydrolase [Kineococcus xinjiangensis]PPK90869.1 HAD superfamily hydrolase (TIGR01450 family) [Kineococcus xinjiangensis]